MTTQTKDNGADALLLALSRARPGGPGVDVGIIGEGDQHQDTGLTVAEVAEFHEFGLGVPQRSFIRAWVDGAQDQIKDFQRKLALRIIRSEITREQALELLGIWAVGEIQKRIAEGIAPDLDQKTIDRKSKDGREPTALINTNQLRSSILSAVR